MHTQSISITKLLDAVPETVFDAWINPLQITEWYGPEGMMIEVQEMNAVEGGMYQLTMKGRDGSAHPLRGIFKTVDRPQKIIMTWQWENLDADTKQPPKETLVTVALKSIGDTQTEMNMIHEGFGSKEDRDSHEAGWKEAIKKLEQLFC